MKTQPSLSRRRYLSATGLAVLGAAGVVSGSSSAGQQALGAIEQPDNISDVSFITRAFEMRDEALATGDQGYGAVVVRDGRIVGQAPSHVVVNGDPTAHAEMEAIRDAARRLGSRDLRGCILYSSSRACPMCEAAAYWAAIDRMVFGRGATDAGGPVLCR